MRIRTRFTLLQLLIIVGFLASMMFVFTQFYRIYRLKQLEIQSIQTRTSLKTLEQNTRLFSNRHMNLSFLWDDWMSSYLLFDTQYTEMLNSPNHQLLGQKALTSRESLSDSWGSIVNTEIKPIIRKIDQILLGELPAITGDNGIRISRQLLLINFGPESVHIQILENIEGDFNKLKESLISSISIPTERFITNLDNEIELFSSKLYITTILISILIQAGGIIFVFLFTRSFSRN
ncbi:MAG: hypothetical protein KAH21_07570, partial [Spirochaetaceae bacterium]|nr:hypothetical protein [Spirochaetaceae bacterium]